MCVAKYRLRLVKKSAKLNKLQLSAFVKNTLKDFGGNSLLSNVFLSCSDDNVAEIKTDKDNIGAVHGALLLCGQYKDIRCCFREV